MYTYNVRNIVNIVMVLDSSNFGQQVKICDNQDRGSLIDHLYRASYMTPIIL